MTIRLDGHSLSRAHVAAMAEGASVSLAPEALQRVARAADFLAEKVTAEEPIYGVNTGLTNGGIIYDDTGREIKQFNVKDGYIISHLKKAGIVVGITTGRESKIVSNRAAELKLDFCHQGIMDKYAVFEKLVQFHKLKKKQVAYIGDDINDLKVLQNCGLSACPAEALDYVKNKIDVITKSKGGEGVAR